MKKWIALALCLQLMLTLLTGCGGSDTMSSDMSDNSNAQKAGRKLGLGSVNTVTMNSTEENRVKCTVAAVVLGKDGKIEECELDELDFTVTMKGGQLQPPADMTTKGEKGDAFLPHKEDTAGESTLTTSWEDRVEKFCDFVEGKMPGEVTGLATTDGKTDRIEGFDLVVTDFIQAIDRAVKAAKAHDIGGEDDLKLAVVTAAGAESTAGEPQYEVELAAVTLDDADRITGCMTDSLQYKLSVTDGVFSTVSGPVESKRQKGDAYGMKEASGIKREWYEQADAFDKYVRGKTAQQVAQLKLDDGGKTDAISGCTIAVTGLMKSVVAAAKD